MEHDNTMKALFIIVNAGFSDDAIEIARASGARGATIINARGEGVQHKSFMGITVDSEKEIILCLVDENTSEKIMADIKEKEGLKSPAHSVCFVMPVEKTTGLNSFVQQTEK